MDPQRNTSLNCSFLDMKVKIFPTLPIPDILYPPKGSSAGARLKVLM